MGLDNQINETIESRLASIHRRMAEACAASARRPDSVQLLAASKWQSVDKIRDAYGYGQSMFGENYAQELATKADQLRDLQISWHFIGRIQSNKIRLIAQYSDCVQTVDNLRHAILLHKELVHLKKLPFPIFIEVNCGHEAQKSGISLDDAEELASEIAHHCPGLSVEGIMAIPPAKVSELAATGSIPEVYLALRSTANRIGHGKLSLGMSADLAAAITAGSTMVRVGTAIFGPRQ